MRAVYHFSDFEEKTAIIGVDGKGEYATTFLATVKKLLRRTNRSIRAKKWNRRDIKHVTHSPR